MSSNTLDAHPQWRFQFYVCGTVGFVVAAIAFAGLRELSRSLRDQLMVSVRDRELIEARAAGLESDRIRVRKPFKDRGHRGQSGRHRHLRHAGHPPARRPPTTSSRP